MKIYTKLWIGIGVLAIISPVGVWLPYFFKAGDAWGEWAPDSVRAFIGYVPLGLKKLSALWKAPVSDYAFKGWEEKGLAHVSLAYVLSAVLGVGLTVGVIFGISRFLVKKK